MPIDSRSPLAQDDELHRFADSRSRETLSVIVEVATPPVRVGRPADAQVPGMHRRPIAIDDLALRSSVAQNHLARVRRALESMSLVQEPTVLPGANSVIADVTPEQLRRIAELPEVAVIRRNREVGTSVLRTRLA